MSAGRSSRRKTQPSRERSLFHSQSSKLINATRYKVLSDEEAVLYALVESSGREGMWTKHLRSKTEMHQTTLIRCLRTLENKNYIKPTRNVKYPGRKNYMLAHLQPSEAATGGPFFTDGVLDDEFVHQMSTWAERYIIGRSWSHRPQSESSKRKNMKNLNREQAEQLRAEEIARGSVGRTRTKDMLPMPPGYTGYPKLSEITKAINSSGLSGVLMKEAEMLQLLNILVWDAKVERVPSIKAYRAVRRVPEAGGPDFENGFTEAPCGRCPVFEICEEGGPVNATTCEYFEDWLNLL